MLYDLRIDGLKNNLTADYKTPRLSYKIKDDRRGVVQKCAEISVFAEDGACFSVKQCGDGAGPFAAQRNENAANRIKEGQSKEGAWHSGDPENASVASGGADFDYNLAGKSVAFCGADFDYNLAGKSVATGGADFDYNLAGKGVAFCGAPVAVLRVGEETLQILLPALLPEKNYCVKVRATAVDETGAEMLHTEETFFRTEPDYASLSAAFIENREEAETISPAHAGFLSGSYAEETAAPWVALDLGKTVDADYIVITGARPFDVPCQPDCPGLRFPLAFRVELANQADFSDGWIFFESEDPYPNPGNQPTWYEVKTPFRYLRFTATRLQKTLGKYDFALEQIQVFKGTENLAFGAKVTAESSVETDALGAQKLVDGDTVWHTAGRAKRMRQPLFFRPFSVKKAVKHAYLYTTALGLYEASLNGEKVGEEFLAPEWTEYRVYANALCHDVTGLLKKENLLTVQTADGYYAGRIGMANVFGPRVLRGVYGEARPKIWAYLMIEYADGSVEKILSDEKFLTTNQGGLLASDLYDGEIFDRTKERSFAEYEAEGALVSAVRSEVKTAVRSQKNEPVGVLERIPQKVRYTDKNGRQVLDFGKVLAGTVTVKLNVPAGRTVRLLYSEHLRPDGTCYFANYRGAQPVDTYVARGGGEEYTPRFTYRGFRYVTVLGAGAEEISGAEALQLSSLCEKRGTFTFDDRTATVFGEIMENTARCNMIGVQTDCCERDERLSWCMDGYNISRYALSSTLFYLRNRYERRVAPVPEGKLPEQTPVALYMYTGQSMLDVRQPLLAYYLTGDGRAMEEDYAFNRASVIEMERKNPTGVIHAEGYVDWLNGDMIDVEGYPTSGAQITSAEFQTCQYYTRLKTTLETAEILGKTEDVPLYLSIMEKIKAGFSRELMTAEKKTVSDTQTSYGMAISCGLIEKADLPCVKRHFLNVIHRYGDRLSCGVYCIDAVLSALSDLGEHELALRLAFGERFPSFGYMIKNGATSVWERWDTYVKERPAVHEKVRWQAAKDSDYTFINEAGTAGLSMNSFCHLEMGSAFRWYVERVFGLTTGKKAGEKVLYLTPPETGHIREAACRYETARGTFLAKWKREETGFTVQVDVPVGTEVILTLPGKEISEKTAPVGGKKVFSAGKGRTTVTLRSGVYELISK